MRGGPPFPLPTSTLTAWCYQTPLGAKAGAVRMRQLEDVEALEVLDAVAVTWVAGAHRPSVVRARHRVGPHLDDGAMLASLARALVAIGTADNPFVVASDVAARLGGTGIDQALLYDVGKRFARGCSTLLVLSGEADLDVVRPVVEQGLARESIGLFRAELAPGAPEAIARALHAGGRA